VKGKWRNEITYETPCLKVGCKSCEAWYGHLLHEEVVEGVGRKRERERKATGRGVRGRCRVKLVFRSLEGREKFRDFVGGG
jgi:hypothetical protein